MEDSHKIKQMLDKSCPHLKNNKSRKEKNTYKQIKVNNLNTKNISYKIKIIKPKERRNLDITLNKSIFDEPFTKVSFLIV